MQGRLVSIACGRQWTILLIERPEGQVRFATPRLDLARFVFYDRPPAPIQCGVRERPDGVAVTWRPDDRAPPGTAGIVFSVAFVER